MGVGEGRRGSHKGWLNTCSSSCNSCLHYNCNSLSVSLCNHADNILQKTTSAICCIDGDGDDAHGNVKILRSVCVCVSLCLSVSLCPRCFSDSWIVIGFKIYHRNSVSLHVSGISILKSSFAPAVVAGGGGPSQWQQRQEDHVLNCCSSRSSKRFSSSSMILVSVH